MKGYGALFYELSENITEPKIGFLLSIGTSGSTVPRSQTTGSSLCSPVTLTCFSSKIISMNCGFLLESPSAGLL